MLTRIRKSMEDKDRGFTLIELLVVIIIIGILAAIAIPTFLRQREKGWDAASKTELKNIATAQESYFTDNNAFVEVAGNTAAAALATLQNEGYNISEPFSAAPGVMSVDTDGNKYCATVQHKANSTVWVLGNTGTDAGAPIKGGTCTNAVPTAPAAPPAE